MVRIGSWVVVSYFIGGYLSGHYILAVLLILSFNPCPHITFSAMAFLVQRRAQYSGRAHCTAHLGVDGLGLTGWARLIYSHRLGDTGWDDIISFGLS